MLARAQGDISSTSRVALETHSRLCAHDTLLAPCHHRLLHPLRALELAMVGPAVRQCRPHDVFGDLGVSVAGVATDQLRGHVRQ